MARVTRDAIEKDKIMRSHNHRWRKEMEKVIKAKMEDIHHHFLKMISSSRFLFGFNFEPSRMPSDRDSDSESETESDTMKPTMPEYPSRALISDSVSDQQ